MIALVHINTFYKFQRITFKNKNVITKRSELDSPTAGTGMLTNPYVIVTATRCVVGCTDFSQFSVSLQLPTCRSEIQHH